MQFFMCFYFAVYKYFVCTYVCLWHACLVPVEAKGGIGFSGTRVTEDYELDPSLGQ